MALRTIRELPLGNGWTPPETRIVHIVKRESGRGYNGTDYITVCELHLTTSAKWLDPQFDAPTCIACLGASL